jgi:hypothetical protein
LSSFNHLYIYWFISLVGLSLRDIRQSVMLATRRPSARTRSWTSTHPEVYPICFYPLPSRHHSLYEKNLTITTTALRHVSCTPSSPLGLPLAFLSTTVVPAPPRRAPPRPHSCSASPREAAPTRLLLSPPPWARWGTACTQSPGVAQALTRGRAATYPMPSSFSTTIAQLDPVVHCSACPPTRFC